MTGNRLKTSTPQTLEFRRPPLLRVGMATGCFLFLVMGILLPADQTARWHDYAAWYAYFPICVAIAVLLAFAAGPQEVCIDLDFRTGYGRAGWPFLAQRRDFAISDTSFLWICPGQKNDYTFLCIKDPLNPERKWQCFFLDSTPEGYGLYFLLDIQKSLPLTIRRMTAIELRHFE